MKLLYPWLPTAIVVFGLFWLCYHLFLTSKPRTLLVIVDSSYSMRVHWKQALGQLESLNSERKYTTFSLYTEKQRIHSWSTQLRMGSIKPYAPFNIEKLFEVFDQKRLNVDEVILITHCYPKEGVKATTWSVMQLSNICNQL